MRKREKRGYANGINRNVSVAAWARWSKEKVTESAEMFKKNYV